MEINDTTINPIKVFLRTSSYSYTHQASSKCQLSFELNEPIVCPSNVDIYMSLESFSFTNSFYTINENNYKFQYLYNGNATFKTLTLGNYDIDSLIAHINSLVVLDSIILSYNSIYNKVTITSSAGVIKLVDDGMNQNCYEILGFDDKGTSTTSNTFTSPYVCNLISNQLLHITTDMNLNSIALKGHPHYNIIDTVLITASPGYVQNHKADGIFKFKLDSKGITSINISILNQDFDTVNFNNIDWFISLNFTFSYSKVYISPTQYIANGISTSMELELIASTKRQHLREIREYHKNKNQTKSTKKEK